MEQDADTARVRGSNQTGGMCWKNIEVASTQGFNCFLIQTERLQTPRGEGVNYLSVRSDYSVAVHSLYFLENAVIRRQMSLWQWHGFEFILQQ